MRVLATFLLLALTLVEVRASPPSPGDWYLVPAFSDEFNGEKLDDAKWFNFNPKWRGREPSRFSLDNVAVSGGALRLLTTIVPEGHPVGREGISHLVGTIRSKRPIQYGYLEVRARIPASKVSSAFWLYDHSDVTWQEIDVFELCGAPPCNQLYNTNIHWGVGKDAAGKWVAKQSMEKFPMPSTDKDGFITAGLEWSRESIKWYVNGRLIRATDNHHIHAPLYIILDNEVMKGWFGVPDAAELPATFLVDYIRVWQRR